jgi:hypothetical protein
MGPRARDLSVCNLCFAGALEQALLGVAVTEIGLVRATRQYSVFGPWKGWRGFTEIIQPSLPRDPGCEV